MCEYEESHAVVQSCSHAVSPNTDILQPSAFSLQPKLTTNNYQLTTKICSSSDTTSEALL